MLGLTGKAEILWCAGVLLAAFVVFGPLGLFLSAVWIIGRKSRAVR